MFNVEIICFGNELLIGKTVNTNASWLGEKLVSLGGKVTRVTTIGDSLEEMIEIVKEVIERKPDVIITTGGMGPTFDDVSLIAIAKATNIELKLNQDAIKLIKQRFEVIKNQRGIELELSEERMQMANLPIGATPLRNRSGTAPGVFLEYSNIKIFVLPGVPKEMKSIFDHEIIQFLPKDPNFQYIEKSLNVFYIPESELAKAISTIRLKYPKVYFKTHPHTYTSKTGKIEVEIHLTFLGTPEESKILDKIEGELIKLIEQLKGAKGEQPIIEKKSLKESTGEN
ncbi:MAG: competence damage-inducible protein A [Asgard group archaeon]|nr:competence damage-inducible protein A [Asgard group archaeon]